MRLTILGLFVLIGVLATACGGRSTAIPTRISPADIPAESDSPRDAADLNEGLPPTWTPPPTSAPAGTAEPPEPTIPPATRQTYTVQPGDTLAEIAERFGVSLASLADANDIGNVDLIEVDDVLIIPAP